MIRARAASMVRARIRAEVGHLARPYRQPEPGEVPLSAEERWHGVVHGLIKPGLTELEAR